MRNGRKDGIVSQLREFFRANPDEELTYEIMAIKFAKTPWTMRNAVMRLRQSGELESLHVIRRKR